ncbi:MAG: ABC transporter ATP-binding protein, partial [Monoglobaceae bacterium]
MIKVNNVVKTFGNFTALNGANINVKKGSVYGLVGPNGAGKTTVIKALTGIYRPDSGKITIDGEDVYENTKIKNRMVYVSDDLYFFPGYSIKDMASFYRGIYGNWSDDRFNALNDIFKIDTKRSVRSLSKGMQKQVAFWLGLSANPDVMILDEPVDGLDPFMRRNVWNLILADVAERELTILVSSHNLRELEDVCDHIGIMNKGLVVIEKD